MLSTLERVLFLKCADIFSAISSEDLFPVALVAQEVTFSTGETIIRCGTQGDCLYVVVDGDVSVAAPGGGQVAIRGTESVLGEMAVLSGGPRSADCVAISEVLALRLDRDDFLELITER